MAYLFRLFYTFLLCLFFSVSYAQVSNPPLEWQELDGSPDTYPYKVKVANGSITDNLDGTITYNPGDTHAPYDATYITQTPNAILTNEQALSALGNGLLKNTTGTGVLSIGVSGVDYESGLSFSSPLTRLSNNVSLPVGDLTELTSSILTILGGSDAVVGSGASITVKQSSSTQSGYLSNTDWSTFNNKVSSVSGSSPISSSGGQTPDISIADAVADGATKGASTYNANDFNSSSGVITIDYTNGQSSSVSNKGFLTSSDWTTFNNKQDTITTTAPITKVGNNISMDNQGTTTTVLHGNSSGSPSFSKVSLVDDITGNLSIYYQNNGLSASSTTFWRGDGQWVSPSNSGAPSDAYYIVTQNNSTLTNEKVIDNYTLVLSDSIVKVADRIEENIMLAHFKLSVVGGLAKYNLVDGLIDEFEDETGVDTGTSTNESYDSTNDLYQPSTSDVAIITQTSTNDAYTIGDVANDEYRTAQSISLSSSALISKVRFRQSTSSGSFSGSITCTIETDSGGSPSGTLVDANATQTFSPPGNGNTVDVTFPGTFTLNASTTYWIRLNCSNQSTDVYVNMSADNTNPYTDGDGKYQVNGGAWTTGNRDFYFILYEQQRQNMTLVSNAYTAEVTPSIVRVVLFEEDVDAVTVNTHIKGYISRDNGTTYTGVTLEDEGDYGTGQRILSGIANIGGQPSGTNMKWKVETTGNKNLKLHGVGVNWN